MSTSIEWCDETWNPVVGCSRVSAGCDHCYAMGVAHRKMSEQHVGLTKLRPKGAARPGVDWTGEVRCLSERLAEPMRWKKPRRVFVNSMSDLFHPGVPFEFVAAVFGVMAACPQHTFLVLTKRPRRAVEFFAWLPAQFPSAHERGAARGARWFAWSTYELDKHGKHIFDYAAEWPWPLPNVHIGVSAEDQATFDERVPLLLQCPAAVRWVSAEPLLGPIDMTRCGEYRGDPISALETIIGLGYERPALDWIVVGGESGPGARVFDIAWARSIVRQCRDAGTPVFVKQLGARARFLPGDDVTGYEGIYQPLDLHDRKGGDPQEWPADLRVRQYPEVTS